MTSSQESDCRLAPPFGVVAERDTHHGRLLTPRSLALAAACLLFRQDLWGPTGTTGRTSGKLSLLGSLCLAAGGNYNENGDPAPPEEEAAADVLACTCNLLAAQLADGTGTDEVSCARRLNEMQPLSRAEKTDIQLLLATVHGVHPPV
jgi:hypothetical protein